MRANHATNAPAPARRAVGGARRTGDRRLPGPRAVAAGGALLAQLWGLGAPGAYAAAAEPLPEPVSRTVGRVLNGGQNPDGESAGHLPRDGREDGSGTTAPGPAGAADKPHSPGRGTPEQAATARSAPGQAASPELLGELAGATAPVAGGLDAATAPPGDVLQDRIRAGGLPLPGQRAAVPDAFAIASGLLGPAPAQATTASARASRDADTEGTPVAGRSGTAARPASSTAAQRGPAAPPPARDSADGRPENPAPTGAGSRGTRATGPGTAAPQEALAPAGATLATAPAGHGLAGTGTAVLAPIAAGLLLTGAAMCKHRGLPRGH
ncbi:hypothetical protein OH807_15045 [Kitasatospora sp. NBC_01560]|uniref:hypothetical protein n=1 Tax=Kitasatospora sp. NBC_01560 TaxID=2975965 RepID=UPI003869A9A3